MLSAYNSDMAFIRTISRLRQANERIDIWLEGRPTLAVLMLILVGELIALMHAYGAVFCGPNKLQCFVINPNGDLFAISLPYVALVMAVLFPVAIEVWREQIVTFNLKEKSPIEGEWYRQTRKLYLIEPVAGLAGLVALAVVAPLFAHGTALFYGILIYGLYVLTYIYGAAFFARPPQVYELRGLAHDYQRPMLNELVSATLGEEDGSNKAGRGNWRNQIDKAQTLKLLVSALKATSHGNKIERLHISILTTRFVTALSPDDLWFALEPSGLKEFLKTPDSYSTNKLVRIAQLLKATVMVFAPASTYSDVAKELLTDVPIDNDGRRIHAMVEPSLKALLDRVNDDDFDVSEIIPENWQVTVAKLEARTEVAQANLARQVSHIYLEWVRDLQLSKNKVPEHGVLKVTEYLFPEVETILFARFVKLAAGLDKSFGKWNLFGGIGRTTADWFVDEKHFATKYMAEQKRLFDATLKVTALLGWRVIDMAGAERVSEHIESTLDEKKPEEREAKGWRDFATQLRELVSDQATEKPQQGS